MTFDRHSASTVRKDHVVTLIHILEHQKRTILVDIVLMAHSRWIPLESNPEVRLLMSWLAPYSREIDDDDQVFNSVRQQFRSIDPV